jgi:hypothetical protein
MILLALGAGAVAWALEMLEPPSPQAEARFWRKTHQRYHVPGTPYAPGESRQEQGPMVGY